MIRVNWAHNLICFVGTNSIFKFATIASRPPSDYEYVDMIPIDQSFLSCFILLFLSSKWAK
jgi:hypothetical protein